jgi:hypothetical protein
LQPTFLTMNNRPFWVWIEILLPESPRGSKNWITELVYPAGKRRDIQSLVLLLDSFVTPRIRLQKSFLAFGEEPRPTTFTTLDLFQDHEDHWLREAWEKILMPALPTIGPRVDLIVRLALMRADQSMRSPGMAASYDPLWHARQDIETRSTGHADAFDFLIEVSLEVIRSRVNAPGQNVIAYLDDLFKTSIPVLQRLAVAGCRNSSILSADQKMRWVSDKPILHSFWFRTETAKLIKENTGSCSPEIKSVILEAVMRGPENDQREGLSPEQIDATTCALVRSLKEADGSWEELDLPLTEFEERYPNFKSMSLSEPPIVIQGAHWVDPAEGFDLEAVLDESPAKFLQEWLAAPDIDFSGKPSQWSYGAILPALAKRLLSWVLILGKVAVERKASAGFVWPSLAQAIYEALRKESDWQEILSLVRSATEFEASRDFAMRTLDFGINADRDPLPDWLVTESDLIADQLTQILVSSGTRFELRDDWVQTAINNPCGWLWRYWIGSGLRWRKTQNGDHRLPEIVDLNLRRLLAENWAGASMARILCGYYFAHLDYLDSRFARTVGIPLFSWSRSEEAASQIWSGFLAGGRWSATLKELILGDFVETFEQWQMLPKASRRELGRHLATVCVLALQDPLDQSVLPRCVQPLPDDILENFATAVSQVLRDMTQDEAQTVWRRWLLKYLGERSLGLPRPWTRGEVQQVPFWILSAGSLFPNAVTTFKGIPNRETINAEWVLHDFEERADLLQYADACAEFILAVTEATSILIVDQGKLVQMVDRLKSVGLSQELERAIKERMLRLGITSIED